MQEYDKRIRRKVYLFIVVLVVFFGAYRIYRHDRPQVKPSQEMKLGVKALTDPESLVKDLE